MNSALYKPARPQDSELNMKWDTEPMSAGVFWFWLGLCVSIFVSVWLIAPIVFPL